MDESVEGLLTVQCSHSFHSSCLGGWRDGSCPVCRCAQSPDPPAASECAQCIADGIEISPEGGALWICLICGHIGCGRYKINCIHILNIHTTTVDIHILLLF